MNDALAALNRLPPEEHVGRTLAEVIPTLAPRSSRSTGRCSSRASRSCTPSRPTTRAPSHRRPASLALELLPGPRRRRRGDRRRRRDHGDHRPQARRRPAAAARRGGRALLDLARPRGDRGPDRAGRRAAAGGLVQRLRRLAATRSSGSPASTTTRELQPLLDSLPAATRSRAPTGMLARAFDAASRCCLDGHAGVPGRARPGRDRPAAFERVGTRSLMFVPIVARGQSLGVLTLGSRERGPLRRARPRARAGAGAAGGGRDRERAARPGAASGARRPAQALEFVGDGVFLVDRDGVVRLWNPAAARITGPGRGRGRRRGRRRRARRLAARPGRRAAAGLPGRRPLRRAVALAHGGGVPHGTVYAFRDLTDERAVEQLKSDFVSTVSHELRTPLAAIYGAAMTLRRDDVVARRRPAGGDARA